MKMEKTKFTYYQENDLWVGWLDEYPEYRTQGLTFEQLKENLKDVYDELNSGKIPHLRKSGELVVEWRRGTLK
jgi:predicted RNase H-like HicB family nuclease